MTVDFEVLSLITQLRRMILDNAEGSLYGDRSKALHDIDAILANPSNARLALQPPHFYEIAGADHGSILHASIRIEEKLINFLKSA